MFQQQLFFLLHCDEWDSVVALPRHKFVTGATLLQLWISNSTSRGHSCVHLFDVGGGLNVFVDISGIVDQHCLIKNADI
jgi:hypothetical protein